MNFYWKYILGFSLFGALFLLSNLAQRTMNLKEKMKENYDLENENYDLENENYDLKKKIDDLKEDNKFLKETVMEFKGGELTKGELIKGVQSLIDKDDKEEIERLERLQKIIQE